MARNITCWNCGKVVNATVFCPQCERIQPCDMSKNPFEVLGVAPSITVDHDLLTATFFELSRLTHPDFFGAASSLEQTYSLEQSAQINDAYRRLSSFHGRVTAYLDSHDLTGALEAWKPPPALLMQVLEWNEEIDELDGKSIEGREKSLTRLRAEVSKVHEETIKAVSEYSEAADQRLLDMVGRIQYIARLKERLEQHS